MNRGILGRLLDPSADQGQSGRDVSRTFAPITRGETALTSNTAMNYRAGLPDDLLRLIDDGWSQGVTDRAVCVAVAEQFVPVVEVPDEYTVTAIINPAERFLEWVTDRAEGESPQLRRYCLIVAARKCPSWRRVLTVAKELHRWMNRK